MSTATPGTTRPLESRTIPVTLADATVCPRAEAAGEQKHTIASHKAGDHHFDRMKQHLRRVRRDPPYTRLGKRGRILSDPTCVRCQPRGGGDSGRSVRRMADCGARRGRSPGPKAITVPVTAGRAPRPPASATIDASVPVQTPRILQVGSPSLT